ncbi:aspartate dehydrogenase [Pseudogracilibacillus sp. SO30301A]|uniref:aspartate dehydrogenase n=1 Tax=Pseudogracilibacillus sp. SO30301A TaxID=3098291 RepID=UPI00300DD477
MKIGIIGAGAIATYLFDELNGKRNEKITVMSVFVRNDEKYEYLEGKYDLKLFTEIEKFLESGIDVVVEAANVEAVRNLLPTVLKQKETVLISIGALAEEDFLNEIKTIADTFNRKLYVPSGAIGGLDLIQNTSAVGILNEATLITRKPANTLVDKPIDESTVIFDGKARDAIKKYPRNMNVSIALALAGIGFDQTKVTFIADPTISKNIHSLEVVGEFGKATFTITNEPLPTNPNTSYLAAVSIIGMLKKMIKPMQIG